MPETAVAVVFGIGLASDVFVEAAHEQAQIGQTFPPGLDDRFGRQDLGLFGRQPDEAMLMIAHDRIGRDAEAEDLDEDRHAVKARRI